MANIISWFKNLLGSTKEEAVLDQEESKPVLKRSSAADEVVVHPKRRRFSAANRTMEQSLFRIRGPSEVPIDKSIAEWTSTEAQPSTESRSRLNSILKTSDFVNNKENVLTRHNYREIHEKTTSSISKSEQSAHEDFEEEVMEEPDTAGSMHVDPGPSVVRMNGSHASAALPPWKGAFMDRNKKPFRHSAASAYPSRSKAAPQVVSIDSSDEDEVQCLSVFPSKKGMHFQSSPYGTNFNYKRVPMTKPSQILKQNKMKPTFYNSTRLAIHALSNIQEKKQFHDLIEKYAATSHVRPAEAKPRYFLSPATLLKSHPVITVDHSSDDADIEVVGVMKSHEKEPVTSATLNGEQGAKAPIQESFLAGNIFSDGSYLKTTAEKYTRRNEETKRKIQKPKERAEFLEAQNKRSATACEESLLAHFSRMEIVLPEIIEVPKLPELTEKMQYQITNAMKPLPKSELLVEAFSLRITRYDMQTLCINNWLNDEVINFYMNLLIERGKRGGFLNVYAFNTFFYPKLLSGGHASLKRWTRKIDIFAQEVVIVPVHLGVHWCLASIDFRDLTIRYYDSMGSQNNRCLSSLLQYLKDESLDKKKCAYDTSKWKTVNLNDIPQQMNGSDCGMFACMFAEFICRNAPITFTQQDMPYFRRKMAYEILTTRLMDFDK